MSQWLVILDIGIPIVALLAIVLGIIALPRRKGERNH